MTLDDYKVLEKKVSDLMTEVDNVLKKDNLLFEATKIFEKLNEAGMWLRFSYDIYRANQAQVDAKAKLTLRKPDETKEEVKN